MSSFPNSLPTVQEYFPLSSKSAPLITRELSSVTWNASSGAISIPSFVQITEGVGTPLTGHLMVMVVFEAAVTLSPIFKVTGLPSPTGISRADSRTSIVGLTGSVSKTQIIT